MGSEARVGLGPGVGWGGFTANRVCLFHIIVLLLVSCASLARPFSAASGATSVRWDHNSTSLEGWL